MKELRRLKVGRFSIDDSIKVQDIENHKDDLEWIKDKIISIEDIFKCNKKIVLEEKKLKLFLNGVNLKINLQDGLYKIYSNLGEFMGTGDVKQEKLKRDIIIS